MWVVLQVGQAEGEMAMPAGVVAEQEEEGGKKTEEGDEEEAEVEETDEGDEEEAEVEEEVEVKGDPHDRHDGPPGGDGGGGVAPTTVQGSREVEGEAPDQDKGRGSVQAAGTLGGSHGRDERTRSESGPVAGNSPQRDTGPPFLDQGGRGFAGGSPTNP